MNNLQQLRSLYNSDSVVKAILDCFSSRSRNARITKVDRLHAVLTSLGHEFTRWELIKGLKSLTGLGYGKFIAGRKGHPSRVEWKVGIVSLGKVAAGLTDTLEEPANGGGEENFDLVVAPANNGDSTVPMMRVRYPLRADLEVELSLPKNLTPREAERLSDFIKTLPFDESRPA